MDILLWMIGYLAVGFGATVVAARWAHGTVYENDVDYPTFGLLVMSLWPVAILIAAVCWLSAIAVGLGQKWARTGDSN